MQAGPLFSVVVPTLGRPQRLEACLGALERLDYPAERFEVVVVNDGGGRPIERVVAGFEDRLALRCLATGGAGAAAARNAGATEAAGERIVFTDDDCEPEPAWLAGLGAGMDANPGWAVGGRVVNGARGRCSVGSQAVLDAVHAHFNRDPEAPRFFATANVAFPAAEFRAVGGFDESFPFAEDRELCDRWLASGRALAYAPQATVRHMRELTVREFWRQHFGYGRGAWAFHRARAEQDTGRFTVEPRFYVELARQALRGRDGAGRPSVCALAFGSQVANIAGFAREAARSRWPAIG